MFDGLSPGAIHWMSIQMVTAWKWNGKLGAGIGSAKKDRTNMISNSLPSISRCNGT